MLVEPEAKTIVEARKTRKSDNIDESELSPTDGTQFRWSAIRLELLLATCTLTVYPILHSALTPVMLGLSTLYICIEHMVAVDVGGDVIRMSRFTTASSKFSLLYSRLVESRSALFLFKRVSE